MPPPTKNEFKGKSLLSELNHNMYVTTGENRILPLWHYIIIYYEVRQNCTVFFSINRKT